MFIIWTKQSYLFPDLLHRHIALDVKLDALTLNSKVLSAYIDSRFWSTPTKGNQL